ncbi:MAG: DUF2029 domain-containing protein [Acidimicrobiales bacterium]|nr:DUF2029 domain-containing protein [Acidimicrobiales bacterium]
MNWQKFKGDQIAIDVILYVFGAGFALATIFISAFPDYRLWGQSAIITYGACALLSIILWKFRRKDSGNSTFDLRILIAACAFGGSLLLPLTTEVTLSASGSNIINTQNEVKVVEQGGIKVAHGQSPYIAPPRKPGSSLLSPPAAMPVNNYFAYLPGMTAFGLPSSTDEPKVLTDARLPFLLVGIGSIMISLLILKGSREIRFRAALVTCVLPTASLPLVTGGDDLPVIGLMVLGATLLSQKRIYLSGIVIGAAFTMKLTAWPILLLLLFVARDKNGKRAGVKVGLVSLVIALPVIASAVIGNPYGFITDAIRYPLGLAGTHSLAASPLPGHLLATWLSKWKAEVTVSLMLLSALILIAFFKRYPVKDVPSATTAAGVVLAVATLLAPATRLGYLIYPVDLMMWGYMLQRISMDEKKIHMRTNWVESEKARDRQVLQSLSR